MALLHSTPPERLNELFSVPLEKKRLPAQEGEIVHELKTEFGMPPVKVRALLGLLREIEDSLSEQRPEHTVVYWAVASHEPAGKSLQACALVPVWLSFVEAEDVPDPERDADFNCVRHMKVRKKPCATPPKRNATEDISPTPIWGICWAFIRMRSARSCRRRRKQSSP